MSHESSALEIHHSPVDRKGTVELTVLIEGEEIHADRIEIGRADNRSKFADDLCRDRGGIDRRIVEAKLLAIHA